MRLGFGYNFRLEKYFIHKGPGECDKTFPSLFLVFEHTHANQSKVILFQTVKEIQKSACLSLQNDYRNAQFSQLNWKLAHDTVKIQTDGAREFLADALWNCDTIDAAIEVIASINKRVESDQAAAKECLEKEGIDSTPVLCSLLKNCKKKPGKSKVDC